MVMEEGVVYLGEMIGSVSTVKLQAMWRTNVGTNMGNLIGPSHHLLSLLQQINHILQAKFFLVVLPMWAIP